MGFSGAGAGKSLCYQLPAVVGAGTVLVVSPLLALMRDQLTHLPAGLPAAMLSAGQPRAEARQVLDDLRVSYIDAPGDHQVVCSRLLHGCKPLKRLRTSTRGQY